MASRILLFDCYAADRLSSWLGYHSSARSCHRRLSLVAHTTLALVSPQGSVLDVWKLERIREAVFPVLTNDIRTCFVPGL